MNKGGGKVFLLFFALVLTMRWATEAESHAANAAHGGEVTLRYRFAASDRVGLHGLMGAFGPSGMFNYWSDDVWWVT